MSDDLVTWLRGQLDDDERVARATTALSSGTWRIDARGEMRDSDGGGVIHASARIAPADLDHIARHDPARVLAEVDAKRRILDRHVPWQSGFRWIDQQTRVPDMHCTVCHEIPADVDYDNPPYAVPWPCPEILDAAAPFADRPGYHEEWRPSA